ncbi:tetratricopeptide repeat protein 14 homolog isoform X1 [Drosophila grimshawi]|uniref:GH19427 n=1 Tax=Drosophila grimshawi TaxID=7222 RepID=B4JG79_DROGR|nr:tetratricopeptide repeat protein 14 homolog isoform X1 [Drosophila grimshawi]EDV93646.1 GH19427 [Drosophila grimshawi]
MNANYISRALCYHGQPLQKIWEDERGIEDLRRLNLTQPNYSVYQERQKYFTFQERAKRLKIHQFLARKASDLYDRQLVGNVMEESWLTQMSNCIAPQPPMEFYLCVKDKRKAYAFRIGALKQGDIVFATVQKVMSNANRIVVKPLCTAEPLHFYLADIPIKAIILQEQWGPLPLDKQGSPRTFAINDFIRCEVCSVSADVERLTLGMLGLYNKNPDVKLGLCDLSDFPNYYRSIHNVDPASAPHYEDQLNAALELENPNCDVLFQLNGLQPNENLTLMSSIKAGFPESDYAPELRQKQASQWAFRSVADGIEHFKNGQQVEAFQCLNKALNIDPRNVEGLVARGALYANRGSFLKGLKDFEKALMLNKYHVNARKYMGETLVALGRSYEEENRIPDAIKAYSDCLNLLPQHEQARISLDALQQQLRPAAVTGGTTNATTTLLALQHQQRGADMLSVPGAGDSTVTIGSTDDSSSSSGSENENDSEGGQPSGKLRSVLPIEQDKRAVSDALSANEFKLDDDETMSSVRRLLREASKHKKSKKKGKKKKDKEKDRKERKKSKSKSIETGSAISATEAALEMLKKIDYAEAFRLMSSSSSDAQLKSQLQIYFKRKQRSETPTPPPPSVPTALRKQPATTTMTGGYNLMMGPSTSKYAAAAAANVDDEQPPPAPKFHHHQQQQQQQQQHQQQHQKLSFQIKKRPLQMDKFGLLRLATPLSSRSRSRSRSPRRRNSRSRSRDRRPSRRRTRSRSRSSRRSSRSRHSRSRRRRSPTRSPSRSRSRSRTRSRSRSRSYSPSRFGGRFRGGRNFKQRFGQRDRRSRSRSFGRGRRTPSPFVPRRTPSPAARYRRTRSRSFSPRRHQPGRFMPRGRSRGRGRFQNRWNFDGRNNDRRLSREKSVSQAPGDGPTIEEVDEMIKEAQKERKQGIIESDKDILKKRATNNNTTSDSA